MTRASRKKREKDDLERLLELMGVFNEVDITDDDTESPDILLMWGGRRIGVEHTECYKGASVGCTSAKTENTLNRIVENAVDAYDAKGGTPLTFGVSFNGGSAVDNPKSLAKILGDFLFQWSEHANPRLRDAPVQVPIDPNAFPELRIVNHIYAQSMGAERSSGFVVSGFHSIDLDETRLSEAITCKAARLSEYRQRCEEAWLLVALPQLYLAADYKLPTSKLVTSKCGFDRVFVLDVYRNRFMEVSEQIGDRQS